MRNLYPNMESPRGDRTVEIAPMCNLIFFLYLPTWLLSWFSGSTS